MKKYTLFVTIFLVSGMMTFAQVGINKDNSNPDASAGLDVNFSNKGFLPPRVSLTAVNSPLPVSSPAIGLLVYNTNTGGTSPNNVEPGYYFWNGTRWISVSIPQGVNEGEMYYWNGTQWVTVPAGTNGQVLTFRNGVPTWAANSYMCGMPVIKSHVAGIVAPVTKTVTYGTVTNIPGEPNKCWITSNLGSDHQATAVSDATEASAGWYWQFNRKQGYKHDGTTLTPGTTWTSSNEDSDWLPSNDPCRIELGSLWRIPSSTEWNNVNSAGGWNDWQDPWNSGLKLHAAGYLDYLTGALSERGTSGFYYASNQINSDLCWNLFMVFGNGSGFDMSFKDFGQSLRCLRSWLMELTTTPASSIMINSATSGGTVTDDGGSAITARGVCWSTSPGPTIALSTKTVDGSGTGSFTSNISGLTPNTTYFIRAYATNSTMTGYGNELSFTTASFTCGISTVTVNHIADSVAPVTKTTTYETVTNIPGETFKCWITSNLGADHQALAVNDATEASAGWYWQFNRKQGYKHDGTTRTPNTTWLTSISENSDWLVANDPCNIELGTQWRIPTYTEWNNVDGSTGGNWANRTDAWSSGLKLHAAGYLLHTNGSSGGRGTEGDYWSSTQDNLVNGSYLNINQGNSAMGNFSKAGGLTLRCIRNLLPVITTGFISNIASSSASSGGNITYDGGSPILTRGVCWSTSTGPTIALSSKTSDGTGTGTFISNFSGLSPNTTYYIRAYATNCVGTVYGNELSFTTTTFSCGTTVLVYHVADSISPVSKTVTYGTITGIPGEASKCWITSNLGADHQAAAVNDATEASAGWYWQFNRKQGYKYDAGQRTPNTNWISAISENSDWMQSNDPCQKALGTGWRIPTYTEWNNVFILGSWNSGNNWNGPWNSNLKIHAAGYVSNELGTLNYRGWEGIYWSSTQSNADNSRDLLFHQYGCFLGGGNKAYGHSLRCLRSWLPELTTTALSSVTATSATSGGNITDDLGSPVTARGVCWSTTTSPTIALTTRTADGSGTGAYTSNISGLTPNTKYYIRAYATTSLGTSYGNELNFTTSAFSCGTSIVQVYHVADTVAPVTKTGVYGTVTNIPGETTKCWITSNLGSDHQATAVDDLTEPSAGWYWQFNRKQGYKHDGTTRTPNTTWVTSIIENSDWTTNNDPCNIELGSQWRVPSFTEWLNVTTAGNWTDWNGPWNSGLKLHAAGVLDNLNGSLAGRGSEGRYWSSSESLTDNGMSLYFNNIGFYNLAISNKAAGISIRCLRKWLPSLTTSNVDSVTNSSVISGGSITDDGGLAITARGVCWSTAPAPTIALSSKTVNGSGTGNFPSKISGLLANTTYHIRAYATSENGTNYGNELSFTTSTFTCGTSTVTVYHVADSVAPVSKTVVYGTVTNIPGETNKCWITRNLGADHQATAVDDATEPSAGWYWQFNRKQGYKHDGSTQTPGWLLTSINENSDWLGAKDPCKLELGAQWSIPSYSEWFNVFYAGLWFSWNDPWNSGLKLHATGYLENIFLMQPGESGNYWSSSQSASMNAYKLNFMVYVYACGMQSGNKKLGYPVRCIRKWLPALTTTPVSAVTNNSAISGGQITDDGGSPITERGVCWNTSTGPTIALSTKTADGAGAGNFTSNFSGLTPNTTYYLRAYATSGNGTAYGDELSFTTSSFTCGTSAVTVYHVADSVAPVAKTVVYGTITNIPGESGKCWITSNLGATQQANSVNDTTEASAGWYWQFNRKQGYKHDGTARTPNTPWINSINENSDWIATNDPCKLELGAPWRIPTQTEWNNVDGQTGGNWTNWNGPWNSGLKLHAAGYLTDLNGLSGDRGSEGHYWSSSQTIDDIGRSLKFKSDSSSMSNQNKAYGFTLRCIRNWVPVLTTTALSSITNSSAISGGNVTDDGGYAITAKGVCWSTNSGPTVSLSTKSLDGSGTGTFITHISGLTPNTMYYLRAYATNSEGTFYGNELSFTTSPFTCGTSAITVYHTADTVAPVTKTVAYGTVINIPGETSKCWITRNLGASMQADSVDATMESKAGWYWQFNRKQGYQYDGTTLTPSWPVNYGIYENSGWLSVNDPCALELGTPWRIPSYTEWNNVDNVGGWTTWNGPWNSGLKLHSAGYIAYYYGIPYFRGVYGYYWSNTQDGNSYSRCLNISSFFSNLDFNYKSSGFSVRCIRNLLSVLTTTTVTSVTNGSAISGGNITEDGGAAITARGVCWSTTPGPTVDLLTKTVDGTGTGSFTSNISGLSPNTTYYIRAYATNSNGTAYGNELSFITSTFTCGVSTVKVYHVADSIAPVAKTVVYGTVANIPGESSKCWISQNLGASQQASGVNDTTQPSTSWYWQFNKKQGFKSYNGNLTPNTTWITSINEMSDWLPANDPCQLELGTQWRIPSYTEWNNVDSVGGWTDWNGPWNSGLKLNAAGYLFFSNGGLYDWGYAGSYWSGTNYSADKSWSMGFQNNLCSVDMNLKTYGYALRCIKSLLPVFTTTALSAVTTTSAISGGNIITDSDTTISVRGVCWSTSSGPTVALSTKTADGNGTGTFTSHISGLTPNTTYYIRAYYTSSNGTAYGNERSFTTLPFTCGTSTITVYHVADSVAPVSKTVIYGTVTNIPGEPSKCWITSNLGADHQATAVNDATEASAGWYWQFNRKQGYKHDGTTLTPNTTWISSINENSDWQNTNDPCKPELGALWRVPTFTEWQNVHSAGGWNDWNGPWNSDLKLHAAGLLNYSNGMIGNRGYDGNIWSSNHYQYDPVMVQALFLSNYSSGFSLSIRTYGFSIRCLNNGILALTTSATDSLTATSAISGGNITGDGGSSVTSRGVCWSTTSGPTIAVASKTTDGSGTGSFTSNISGLNPNTTYYMRAYATNYDGTAYGNELSFTTSSFACGSSVTVYHYADSVAPVAKSTAYGTVTNIPGETSKCWITSNLGSDHQATAVNDATEASAGWYWQFNRKQGYKWASSGRIPNTTWITFISENSDWLTANDPCKEELGAQWRIPSNTEWYNVSVTGNWYNFYWNGPWNSDLKLHAAGYLNPDNGNLWNPGQSGNYWSSTKISDDNGWFLGFGSNYCVTTTISKANGYSLRCLRSWLPVLSTSAIGSLTSTSATSGGIITDDGGAAVTARGVCWSTTTGPTTALSTKTVDGSGTGTFTSNISGLTPNTIYYMRAYASSSRGTNYGNELSFTTSAFICGTTTLTVYHVADTVAPVAKTVVYGTVTNIPGETSKCWITSNLGSDHQATTVSDATEASAGWYWQFNRKQGFKHDGTTRTPNTT